MIKYTNLLFVFFVTFQLTGQTIQVKELESKFPIDRVLIYNKDKTIHVSTDKDGKADISLFPDTCVLFFQHLSFIDYSLAKSDVLAQNAIVFLENDSQTIDEVVLSVSRNKEKRTRIAEHIEVITQHKISLQSPQTTADLLALTPGVKVQKTQFGGGSPVLRGMEANRVLLVVDGVRMNNAIYRKGHIQNSITVSPNLLARTEVLFGPSSIIYGSDALGGVIHYYTKKPMLTDDNLFSSSLFTRYSSVNNELTASYTGDYSSKKWGSLTGITLSKFSDLKMGKNRKHGFKDWGLVPYYSRNTENFFEEEQQLNRREYLQKNTGHSQIDLLQKFLFPLNTHTDLTLNFQYSNSTNINRFDKLQEVNEEHLKYAEWYYGPQKRFLASSQLSLKPELKWLKEGRFTVAYQDIFESRNERKFGSFNKYFRDENVKVFSVNGDFHVPLTKDDKRILSYGFETAHNRVTSKAISKELAVSENEITGFQNSFTIQSRYPDGGSTYTNFALYSNYRFDHSRKGTLNIGLRYTHTLLKAKWIDETFIVLPNMDVFLTNAAFSGTLGYAYKPNKLWQINTVFSSGFRSPNIDDIGKIREKKGKVSIPNTELKPEYAYNAEMGISKHSQSKKTRFGINVYYMLLQNYIARDFYKFHNQDEILYDGEMAQTIANVNKGNAFVTGGTFSFQSQINTHLKAKASTTYTQGKSYDSEEPLSSIPPLFLNAGLSYHHKKWDFNIDYRYNAHKKASDYNITEGIDNIEETPIINPEHEDAIGKYYGTPSWSTLDFSTQYKLSRNATIHLHFDNIFDVHYKEFVSGVSSPGRNISLAVNMHF